MYRKSPSPFKCQKLGYYTRCWRIFFWHPFSSHEVLIFKLSVGENRSLQIVEEDAIDFLRVLHDEGFYDSEEAFQNRLDQVQGEIKASSVKGVVREDHSYANIAGTWTQTPQELEFGIRRAWRNARKCIMRSHCEELKLCDLRGITSSAEMVIELVKGISGAFNGGNVQPTVFVFPPRKVNTRGPMIWNHQVLQFAGYETDDGTVLGDPSKYLRTIFVLLNLILSPISERGGDQDNYRSRVATS